MPAPSAVPFSSFDLVARGLDLRFMTSLLLVFHGPAGPTCTSAVAAQPRGPLLGSVGWSRLCRLGRPRRRILGSPWRRIDAFLRSLRALLVGSPLLAPAFQLGKPLLGRLVALLLGRKLGPGLLQALLGTEHGRPQRRRVVPHAGHVVDRDGML